MILIISGSKIYHAFECHRQYDPAVIVGRAIGLVIGPVYPCYAFPKVLHSWLLGDSDYIWRALSISRWRRQGHDPRPSGC